MAKTRAAAPRRHRDAPHRAKRPQDPLRVFALFAPLRQKRSRSSPTNEFQLRTVRLFRERRFEDPRCGPGARFALAHEGFTLTRDSLVHEVNPFAEEFRGTLFAGRRRVEQKRFAVASARGTSGNDFRPFELGQVAFDGPCDVSPDLAAAGALFVAAAQLLRALEECHLPSLRREVVTAEAVLGGHRTLHQVQAAARDDVEAVEATHVLATREERAEREERGAKLHQFLWPEASAASRPPSSVVGTRPCSPNASTPRTRP